MSISTNPEINTGLFRRVINALIPAYRQKTLKIYQQSCAEFTTRVVRRTPIDTGKARASWNGSIGAAESNNIDLKTSKDRNDYIAVISQLKPGEKYFLANGQPYIDRLEYGWSIQAPQGMVRITVAEWPQIVNEVTKALR